MRLPKVDSFNANSGQLAAAQVKPLPHYRRFLGSSLSRNMISGSFAATVGAAVNIISYPIYLHFLGYRGLGIWLALSLIITVVHTGNLGIPNAVAKIVAENNGAGDIQGVKSCATNALAIVGLVGLTAASVVWLVRDHIVIALGLWHEHGELARTLVPYVGFLSAYALWVNSFNAILAGLGRMDISSLSQAAAQAIGVITSTAILVSGHGVESLLLGTAVSYVCLNIMIVMFLRRISIMPVIDMATLSFTETARILSFGAWLFGGSLVSLLLSPLNKLLLAQHAGVEVLPIYEMAHTGAMRVRGLIESGLQALMLEVSGAAGAGPAQVLAAEQKVARTFYLTLLTGLALFGLVALFAPVLLHLWLGTSLHPELPGAFRIMMVAAFASLLGVPAYYKLMGSGRVRVCFLSLAVQAGMNTVILIMFLWAKHTLTTINTCWSVVAGTSASTFLLLWSARPTCTRTAAAIISRSLKNGQIK